LDGANADPDGIVVEDGDYICADSDSYDIGVDCNGSPAAGGCPGLDFDTQLLADLDVALERFALSNSTSDGVIMIRAWGSANTENLLVNGDFDAGPGSPWVESGPFPLIVGAGSLPAGLMPHSGSYATWQGGDINLNDALYQVVTVPDSVTSLMLTGVRSIATEELSLFEFDTVTVSLRSYPSLTPIEILATWSNLDATLGWVSFSFLVTDAGSLAGQPVAIHFASSNDGSNVTNFHFDTLYFLPEPSGLPLLGAGIAVLLGLSRMRRR
jgi:hypothetical protein